MPIENAIDALGEERQVSYTDNDNSVHRCLSCSDSKVSTYDYLPDCLLPGELVSNPPSWSGAAVSAHVNTIEVATFIRDVLDLNGIDDDGKEYISTINFTDGNPSPIEHESAYWHPSKKQAIYGQRSFEGNLLTYAASLTIVAHEVFHGVTQYATRPDDEKSSGGLECCNQSGALNESYSDIFAVLVANFNKPVEDWDWEIGNPLGDNPDETNGDKRTGFPVRDLSNPALYAQSAHMDSYEIDTERARKDQGGVHINNGIHNLAAYQLLSARDENGQHLLNVELGARLFLRRTEKLREKSNFSDSRLNLTLAAATLFRDDPNPNLAEQVRLAIDKAFSSVGID